MPKIWILLICRHKWGGGLKIVLFWKNPYPHPQAVHGFKSHAFENSSLYNIWYNPAPLESVTMGAYISCLYGLWIFSRTAQFVYRLLTRCEVKVAGRWPSFFFTILCLRTETESRSIHMQKKKNKASILPSWPNKFGQQRIYFMVKEICFPFETQWFMLTGQNSTCSNSQSRCRRRLILQRWSTFLGHL